MALLAKNLMRSETGRAFMAVRDMDVAASVIGIPMMKTKLLAFAISSFYCGVAGALHAFCYLGTVEPEAYTLDLSFRILFMIIIGGVGSILGSLPRRGVHYPVPDLPQHRLRLAVARLRHRDLACHDLQPGAHHLRRADHLLPHRRAERPRPALADHEGEAAPVAVPALTGLYWPPVPEEETRMKRSTLAIAALALAAAAGPH